MRSFSEQSDSSNKASLDACGSVGKIRINSATWAPSNNQLLSDNCKSVDVTAKLQAFLTTPLAGLTHGLIGEWLGPNPCSGHPTVVTGTYSCI
jgi:hypothetical protein